MTTLALSAPSPALAEIRRWYDDAPAYAATAILLALLAVPTFAALLLDARTIDDISGWTKPLKFQLALSVYAGTLAFYARFIRETVRDDRLWRLFTALVVFCIFAETAWLVFAAGLGERAHFNTSHALLTPVYPVMGILATILTAATAQFAWGIHRHATRLEPALRSGLVWGLGLTLPLTLVTAFWLSTGAGHHVEPGAIADVLANGPAAGTSVNPLAGTLGSDANGATLFGWARENGDLRVAHFFATHAMHGVPLLALVFAALGAKGAWSGRIAAFGWTALVAATFAQALAGRPFLPFP